MSTNFSTAFSPGQTTNQDKKKRKRKKKKKTDSVSSSNVSNNVNDSQRVQSFIQMGYTQAQVHQCMDLMFAAGEDMNDNKKVKEFLHRMKSGEVADSKTSKSSVKATQSEAAAVTRAGPTSSLL